MRYRFPECRMVGIDYEDKFPWGMIENGEQVIMVDFSLPMDLMEAITEAYPFIWIDHHKTAIDKARQAGFETPGLLRVGTAACELTWQYFFPGELVPDVVFLLGRYDVWDEKNPHWVDSILPFQYGLRKEVTDPANPDTVYLWTALLREKGYNQAFEKLINEGEAIIRYQQQQDAKLMARHAFYTDLDGFGAVAVNHGISGSMKFEGDFLQDQVAFPLCISFARLPEQKWLVNLYTFREDVDVGEIAKRHGGGGHQKVAGFICDELPFRI